MPGVGLVRSKIRPSRWLSLKEQAELYQQAITNHRKLEKILRQMRELSQQVLLGSVPGARKRARNKHPKKPLS